MGESNLDQLRIDELQEASSELFQSSVMKMFGEKDERKKVNTCITICLLVVLGENSCLLVTMY